MVGVCLTVIGIFQISKLKEIGSISDNLLAVDAIAFLVSCILSYIVLRSGPGNKTARIIERIADTIFLSAMGMMAIVCVLIAYEFL